MDKAFSAVRHAEYEEVAAGVPQGRPAWFIPVVVGIGALIVGGVAALIAMLVG